MHQVSNHAIQHSAQPVVEARDLIFLETVYRVSQAVIDFFKDLAAEASIGLIASWNDLVEFWKALSSTQRTKRNAPDSLAAKLAPFEEMPGRRLEFLTKAIANFSEMLRNKEEENLKKIPKNQSETTKIHEDTIPYTSFQKKLEILDGGCFPLLALAIVRAYVFSDVSHPFNFLQRTEWSPGELIPPIYFWGRLIHPGGRQMVRRTVNYQPKLKALQEAFHHLSFPEQESLLDAVRLEDCECWPGARKILLEMNEVANRLHQANPAFLEIIQNFYTTNHRIFGV